MSQREHRAGPILIAGAATAAVVAVGVALIAALTGTPPTGALAPRQSVPGSSAHQPDPTSIRTVLVSDTPIDFVSEPGGDVRGFLTDGDMPDAGTRATVLTDENCAPDERGVSHCVNQLELVGGDVLEVIHHHRMNEVPCLSPGEAVLVEPVV